MLGKLNCSGSGSKFSATDFAVNANQPNTASATAPTVAPIVALLQRSWLHVRRAHGRQLERDRRDDVLARVRARARAAARELIEIGRRGIAGRDDHVGANDEPARRDSAGEPRAIERNDVAVLELAGARDALAAYAQIARVAARLEEEHLPQTADLDRARQVGEPHVRARIAADRDRQLRRAELEARAELLDRNDPVRFAARAHLLFLPAARVGYIGSTQITLTGGRVRPGTTVKVWRTSR